MLPKGQGITVMYGFAGGSVVAGFEVSFVYVLLSVTEHFLFSAISPVQCLSTHCHFPPWTSEL